MGEFHFKRLPVETYGNSIQTMTIDNIDAFNMKVTLFEIPLRNYF
jgi:hypothetical protein